MDKVRSELLELLGVEKTAGAGLSEALNSTGRAISNTASEVGSSIGNAATSTREAVTKQIQDLLHPRAPGFGPFDKQQGSEILDQVTQNVVRPLQGRTLLRSATLGGGVGLGLASLIGLARILRSSSRPTRNTYTLSPEIEIYAPKRPESRRRVRKVALSPTEVLGLSGDPVSRLVGQDPTMMAKSSLLLAAGVPIGFAVGDKLTKVFSSIARQRELQAARAEYEQALRESAEIPAAGKGKKLATAPSDIQRLASNCQQLLEMAGELKLADGIGDYIPKSIQPMALASLTMLPILGGYYGFTSRWNQRKQPALEYAERKANLEREATNPTYPMASLVNRDDDLSEEERNRLEAARSSMDSLLADSDFDYID